MGRGGGRTLGCARGNAFRDANRKRQWRRGGWKTIVEEEGVRVSGRGERVGSVDSRWKWLAIAIASSPSRLIILWTTLKHRCLPFGIGTHTAFWVGLPAKFPSTPLPCPRQVVSSLVLRQATAGVGKSLTLEFKKKKKKDFEVFFLVCRYNNWKISSLFFIGNSD